MRMQDQRNDPVYILLYLIYQLHWISWKVKILPGHIKFSYSIFMEATSSFLTNFAQDKKFRDSFLAVASCGILRPRLSCYRWATHRLGWMVARLDENKFRQCWKSFALSKDKTICSHPKKYDIFYKVPKSWHTCQSSAALKTKKKLTIGNIFVGF